MLRRWPLHPFLLCLYLTLGLVAQNLGEAFLSDAWRALLVLLICTTATWAILTRALGDPCRAGLLASVLLISLWSHSFLLQPVEDLLREDSADYAYWIALGCGAAVFILLAALSLRIDRAGSALTPLLNIVCAALVVVPIGEIVLYGIQDKGPVFSSSPRVQRIGPQALKLDTGGEAPPDIYYVLLDGYARGDVLRELFGRDTSNFLDGLEERGFFVAEKSRSNYLVTLLSVPSILNFEYLDSVAQSVGPDASNLAPLLYRISHNKVASALRGAGYRIVNIQSGIDYTKFATADEIVGMDHSGLLPNDFESVLLRMTPLPELLERLAPFHYGSPSSIQRRQIEYALEELGSQASLPGPKFVSAHIFSPHNPFVFDADGNPASLDFLVFEDYRPTMNERFARAYGDQVHHLNRLILKAIDRILEASARPPVIVLQADHGLRLLMRPRPEQTCLRESFAILNALYLPGSSREREKLLHASLSPVNTFRLIFDVYFGTNLGLLEDRSYFSHRDAYYDFKDVTSRVETCTQVGGRQ